MTTNALLLTVWHTGTKYFLRGLEQHYRAYGRATYSHLNDRWQAKAEKADIIYTTYRDPLRVAASWGNRGHFNGKNAVQSWESQWAHYKDLLDTNPIVLDFTKGRDQHGITFPANPINTYRDELKLHQALNEGNHDYFYRKVPRWLVDHALECCG